MFTHIVKSALVAGVLIGAHTTPAVAQNAARGKSDELTKIGVKLTTSGSVDETVAGLRNSVAENGMMVMGEIHQGKVLAMTGLKVESETLFVGNPNVGKQLFSEEPGVGLVVPIRINIYADQLGKTHVRYIPPSQQLHGFGNDKVDQIAKMLDKKLEKMGAMLTR